MVPLPFPVDSYIYVLFITFLPYIELRGSIPVGIGLGLDPLSVFLVSTIANILIIFPIFVFLQLAFDRLFRIDWIKRHFWGKVQAIRSSVRSHTRRYGMVGLAAFVAIPLPGTGAYTGCLAAFLLDMDRKRASLAIALGVTIAGVLVTLASVGAFAVIEALDIGWPGILLLLALVVIATGLFLRSRHQRAEEYNTGQKSGEQWN